MIFKTMTNSNPMLLGGMAIKRESDVVPIPTSPYDPNFCYCNYVCNECTPVWGGSSINWQNDKTTFAFVKPITSDTFTISIWKNGVKQADVTDNSYGIYVSSYVDNPKQYSFIADWDLIYSAFGHGTYQIKNNYTILGDAKEFISNDYCLSLYDDESANGYIKLEWYQEGQIESSNFNFCTPLYHSLKIKGDLILQAPETIKDSYQTSKRETKQFRTEQKNNYLLKSKLIRENLLSLLNENTFLAEKITLTDFNLFGTKFIQKDLTFNEVANLEDFLSTLNIDLEISFSDYKQDIIKNNC